MDFALGSCKKKPTLLKKIKDISLGDLVSHTLILATKSKPKRNILQIKKLYS